MSLVDPYIYAQVCFSLSYWYVAYRYVAYRYVAHRYVVYLYVAYRYVAYRYIVYILYDCVITCIGTMRTSSEPLLSNSPVAACKCF